MHLAAIVDWVLPPGGHERKAVDAGSALLRIVAVACVVLLHMKSYFNVEPSGMLSRKVVTAMFACCFWAVPAFVILSGYHAMQRLEKTGVGEHYSRRFAWLSAKTLFWGVFFTLLCGVIGKQGRTEWIADWLRCRPFFHLWYLFMLVGLYALAPVCRMVLRNRYAMMGAFAVQIFVMVDPTLFDAPFWQHPVTISIPYIVPFMLGGMLSCRQTGPCLGRFSIAVAILYFMLVVLAWQNGGRLGSYPVCHYLGFFGLAGGLSMVASLLYLGRRVPQKRGVWLFRASRLVLGVYILHPLVMTALSKAVRPSFFSGIVGLVCGWTAASAASFALAALMLKVPILRRFL